MKCYLSGPINNADALEIHGWRELVKSELGESNCVDPSRRIWNHDIVDDYINIVETDKSEIVACNILMANITRYSTGTPMEIHLAWSLGMTVITVYNLSEVVPPWITYHSTRVFKTLGEAISFIKTLS